MGRRNSGGKDSEKRMDKTQVWKDGEVQGSLACGELEAGRMTENLNIGNHLPQ